MQPFCCKLLKYKEKYRQTELYNVIQYCSTFFDVLLTVHLSMFISVINQLDAQKFCFAVSLFHASTCFEHMCSSSGGQNCITQPLVSSHLQVCSKHVEARNKLIVKQKFCASSCLIMEINCSTCFGFSEPSLVTFITEIYKHKYICNMQYFRQ